MAPVAQAAAIQGRALCDPGWYYSHGYCYRNSSWYGWGRWVFAGCLVIFVIALLILMARRNARRRRAAGLVPRYGTGWVSGPAPPYQHQPPPPQYSAHPPPLYPQPTGYKFNANEGYYGNHGNQQEGIELQQPPHTYQPPRADEEFAPPPGPPPGQRP